jgi:hypothetical protein
LALLPAEHATAVGAVKAGVPGRGWLVIHPLLEPLYDNDNTIERPRLSPTHPSEAPGPHFTRTAMRLCEHLLASFHCTRPPWPNASPTDRPVMTQIGLLDPLRQT